MIEFYEIIHAMEETQKIGLTNVWLECDYALVCPAFIVRTNVPWMLRNRWNTCLNYGGKIRFRVTYIFREGNACGDKLANLEFIHRCSCQLTRVCLCARPCPSARDTFLLVICEHLQRSGQMGALAAVCTPTLKSANKEHQNSTPPYRSTVDGTLKVVK